MPLLIDRWIESVVLISLLSPVIFSIKIFQGRQMSTIDILARGIGGHNEVKYFLKVNSSFYVLQSRTGSVQGQNRIFPV